MELYEEQLKKTSATREKEFEWVTADKLAMHMPADCVERSCSNSLCSDLLGLPALAMDCEC